MKAKSKALQLNIHYTKVIFAVLGAALFLLLFLYSYFINASVLNIVERKEIEKKLVETNSYVSALESEYFKQIGGVNLDLAFSLGFEEVSNSNFAYRKSSDARTVTLNRN
ncbi:hypothetical protein ACFL0K_01245 [Patescibacteria group bacterium]